MKASELFAKCPGNLNSGKFPEEIITGMTYDSKKAKPGNIFFAIKGLKDDGNKYIKEAVSKGVKIVFTEEDIPAEEEILIIKVNEIRKLMAVLSRVYYTKGLNKIKLIGVTGTNGKTTTSYLMKYLLDKSGYNTGLIGTIDYKIGERSYNSTLTTPDSIEMNMILGEMEKSNTELCIMEVSSVALHLDRVYGLNFDTALFTNLTSEHMDYHINMENYLNAKKILFDNLSSESLSVSNADDEYGEKILEDTKSRRFYYSMKKESDFKAYNEKLYIDGLEFETSYDGRNYKFVSGLTGRFNIYNILASVSAVMNYDTGIEEIQKYLPGFSEVKGRFNRVKLNNGATAVIDYSHTSDSLKNAIESAREIINSENKGGRVITIFGCGGDKDKTKRPVMGKYASMFSDYSIITSDNPRSEDPYKIIDDIIKGMMDKKNTEVIEDREKAIERGIEISDKGDIILICGKGHENYQEVKGIKKHFDDREIVEKYSIRIK